jgi:hypothetical protein
MSAGSVYVILVLLSVASFFAIVAARAFMRYRGVRVVTCPETQQPAAVRVDAGHAALSAAWDRTELRLEQCSRWPERAPCAQDCVAEVAAAPRDCLVRSVLARWYEGKRCAICDKPVSIRPHAQQPALRHPDGHTFDFVAVPPEKLIARLSEFAPVCFDCHVAEQFRNQYPGKVTERPSFEHRA